MTAPRIAIVGARRVRQGLGPFVARFLADEGAEVPAFLGTSASSVSQAARDLEEDAGLEARGYTSLDDMLADQSLDALAILSPAETHERYLVAALDAGLHVLCEKPLIWGRDGLTERAHELDEAFRERGLLLTENCQWPYVLPAFRALHPEAADEAPTQFAMRLSPASRGIQMLGDALPHPLSVLQALAPSRAPSIEGIELSTRDPRAEELVLRFDYHAGEGPIEGVVELIRDDRLPREASLTINGRSARRRVRMDDYSLFLGSGDREVQLEDPLRALLRSFVTELTAARHGRLPAGPAVVPQRMAMIDRALRAFREEPL